MSTRSHDLLEKHGKDFKFAVDFDKGITLEEIHPWTKKKVKIRVRPPRSDNGKPREAILSTYSWVGSLGAVHTYAKISLGYPRYEYSNGKQFGFVVPERYDNPLPLGAKHVEFEVTRRCDKRDFKHDKDMAEMMNSPIYGRMKKGDWTHGFWTEAEALAAAIAFFKAHFAPGWILVPDSWESGPRPTIATT